MDNAIPIPFLHDPERPEHSYQLGFALSPTVKKQLDEYEPSLVHITVPDSTSLHVIQYARNKEIPMMGTFHSNIPEYMEHYPGLSWLKHILGAFFRHQYNYLQALYVPTPFIQRHLIDSYEMDRVTTLKVWGRGVDVEKFSPAYRSLQYRQTLGVDDDTPIVLWVGRLVPEKRPDIFASVVRRLHSRGIKFHALVVGAGPSQDEIKSLPNTTFAGWMNADQLSTVYASSDVFLFPSAVETFGNVTLEAAASGLPVVVEAGCSGHLVHDGENGFAAPADDEEAFFEATLVLLEDRQLREEYSASSREIALSMEKSSVVRQMLDNYSFITDQFYTEYAGRHANRDAIYTRPGSFLLGRYPRPMILVFVEFIFILLFKLVWNITVAIACCKQCLKCLMKINSEKSSASPSRGTGGLSPKRLPSPPSSAVSRVLKEKQAAIDSTASKRSVVNLSDVEIGGISKEPLLSADDLTSATESSSQDASTASHFLGDSRLSHRLAMMFVSFVQFQCLLESNVRFYLSTLFSPPQTQFTGAAKRKNSNMTTVMHTELGARTNSAAMRGRSAACDEVDVALPVVDESPTVETAALFPEGRMIRRNQS
jgi:phosphatidylinositol alpha 1,6-mannosyltransferase